MKKIIVLLIFLFIGCKNNTSNNILNIKDETKINNLEFKTLSVIKINNVYTISTKITNNGNVEKIDSFNIIIKDNNENIISNTKGIVGNNIDKDDYVKVVTNIYENIDDISKIEYSL